MKHQLILLACLLAAPTSQADLANPTTGKVRIKALPLPLMTVASGTIATPAEQDRFIFPGIMGQRLYFDALDVDSDNMDVQLVSPSGANVWTRFQSYDFGPFYLVEDGTYTIVVVGRSGGTGDYSFRLIDISNSVALTLGSATAGQLSPPSEADVYRYDGTAGQRLKFESLSPDATGASWRLVGPGNQVWSGPASISADLGEVVLPVTGTYVLLVEGTVDGTTAQDYQVLASLVSNPTGTASGFGTVKSGTLAAEETATVTFTAPAGLVCYYDSLVARGSAAIYAQLLGPDTAEVFKLDATYDLGPYRLPQSGTYTLNLIAAGAGDYEFRLLNLSADSIALNPGVAVTANLDVGYKTVIYSLSGSPGQRLYYDALEADQDFAIVNLIAPSGNQSLASGNSDFDFGPITLTEPGTYYLTVESQEAGQIDANFQMLDLSAAAELPLDTTLNGDLTPGTRSVAYRFSGLMGQRLYIDSQGPVRNGTWTLYDASNQSRGYNALGIDFEVTLPSASQYVLLISGNSATEGIPMPYTVRVVKASTTTFSLVLGAITSGTLTNVGEEHHYSFTGAAGQRLYYDALDSDADNIPVRLRNPQGSVAHVNGNSDSDVAPFTLLESGVYTLIIGGNTDVTSDYSFRLIDVAQNPASALALDTTFNGNLEAGKTKILRFDGMAGQRLFFDGSAEATSYWSLYSPNDQQMNFANTSSDFVRTLTQTGQYLLVLTGDTSSSTTFSVRIVTPGRTTTALALGTSISGNLTEPGEEHRYTFTGTAGQRLYYDALETDFDNVSVMLLDSDENAVFINGNSDSNLGPFTLTRPGNYTLVLGGASDTLAGYRFRLLDLLDATLLGTSKSGTLKPAGQAQDDVYQFGSPGRQTVHLTSASTSSPEANWRLVGPDDQILASAGISSDLGQVALRLPGTYYLVVEANAGTPSPLEYQISADFSDLTEAPAGFGEVHGDAIAPGQEESFTFTAPAGLPVFYDAQSANTTLSAQLLDVTTGLAVFDANAAQDAGPFLLPSSGTYTLTVKGTDPGATGDYRFRLLDMSVAPALSLGTPTSAATDAPFKTDIYRFTANLGQHFYFDALGDPAGGNIILFMANANGSLSYGCSFGGCFRDIGPFSFQEGGTHYLILPSQQEANVEYSFRLLDAAQAPVSVIAFDTPVGGTLNPGSQADLFQFTGSAGQRLYFDGMGENAAAYWYLYGPTDQSVSGNSVTADFEVTLPQDGTYFLVVTAFNSVDPVPYSIRIVTPNTVPANLALENVASGTLTEAGEEHHLKFTGAVGQRLYYDSLQNDFAPVSVRLINPSGNWVFLGGNSDSDAGPSTLTESGVYTLVQDSNTDGPADYSFRLLDVGNRPFVAFDTLVSGTLQPGTQAQLFRLASIPSLRLYFQGLGAEAGSVQFFSPVDASLASGGLNGDMETTMVQPGEHVLLLTGAGADATPYAFKIIPGNHGPLFPAISNRTINEEGTFALVLGATDPELPNDRLTYSLDPGSPPGLSLDAVTGAISWTPTEVQGPGSFTLTVRVADDGVPSFSYSESVILTVHEVNKPPVLAPIGDKTINELATLTFTASATDPDLPGNTLTFTLGNGAPTGASINPVTGVFTWTPTEGQGSGLYPISIVVTDSSLDPINPHLVDSETITVRVNEVNVAPVLAGIGNKTVNELSLLAFTVGVTDVDLPANTLTFTLAPGAPPGATVNPATGAFSWTPTEAEGPGNYQITVLVTDTGSADAVKPSLNDSETFTVAVNEVNSAPVLAAIGAKSVNELSALTFTATATDSDLPGNALAFSLGAGVPAGASINSVTGAFSWTPAEAQGPGTYTITVVVTDNGSPVSTDSETMTVTVGEINTAPVLEAIPSRTAHAGQKVSFTARATDSDLPANVLTYSLDAGAPAGATINAATGVFDWKPAEADAGRSFTITVQVADNGAPALSARQTFSVTVVPAPAHPVDCSGGGQSYAELERH